MRAYPRAVIALVALGLVAVTTACSSNSAPTTAPSSTSARGPLATFTTLTGTSTVLTLDSAFRTRLTALHVAPEAAGRTTFDTATGTLTFPITGGHATLYAKGTNAAPVQGRFEHAGSGLTLRAGTDVVTLQNPVIDPSAQGGLSATVLVGGKSLGAPVTLFTLDTSASAPSVTGSVATVTGIPVYVAAAAATALNAVLKLTGPNALPTTEHGVKVGEATITAKGS